MSTRANIIIKDGNEKLYFYRHSDGYPSVTGESLKRFLQWLKERRIRDNIQQAAGWLIVLGQDEEGYHKRHAPSPDGYDGWKVGAYEPTTGIHGDVEFIYEIDLTTKKIKTYRAELHPEFPQWRKVTND